MNFQQLLERTYNLHWAGTRGEETAYKNAQDVIAVLGGLRKPSEITRADIQEVVAALRAKKLNPATINRKLAALSKMLSVAEDAGVIDVKPRITRLKESEGRSRFLTRDEEARLFRFLDPEHSRFCVFLVDTGLRVGEALKLTWRDIQDGKVTARNTKGGHPRTVPLTRAAQRVLNYQMGLIEGPWASITPASLRKHWSAAKEAAGLADDPEVVPHILRHTCASRLVQAGVSLQSVQAWMGHKSLLQTMRYAHLAPNHLQDALEALEAL